MDYSKVKFVTPSVSARDITKGKVYPVLISSKDGYMRIYDDVGYLITLFVPECAHLDRNPWIPCHEDGTPLTKELTPLEAEMYEMLKSCLAFVDALDLHGIVDNWSERPKLVELIKKVKQ